MKTIKIIDLLNEIANGKVYKHIRFNDRLNRLMSDECVCNIYAITKRLFNDNILINDFVEILDEDEFEDIEEIDTSDCTMSDTFNIHEDTINDLIKNQKKIIERIKND